MTEQEQRIAIAKACGRNGWWCPECKKVVPEASLGYQARHANCSTSAQRPPDYLHDLDAMHAAEALQSLNIPDYVRALAEVCEADTSEGWSDSGDWFLLTHATASQRAEAFLRTIGKWRDEGEQQRGINKQLEERRAQWKGGAK